MKAQSRTFRLRAVQSEQRAHDASDPIIRAEWEELAIEWHLLANAVAHNSGPIDQIDVGQSRASVSALARLVILQYHLLHEVNKQYWKKARPRPSED